MSPCVTADPNRLVLSSNVHMNYVSLTSFQFSDPMSATAKDALIVIPDRKHSFSLCPLGRGYGIHQGQPYLRRTNIIRRLEELLKRERVVLLCAPPGSGKVSLMQLLSVGEDISLVYVFCLGSGCPYKLFRQRNIDFENKKWGVEVNGRVVVAIDGAQRMYQETEFWSDFFLNVRADWIPKNVSFLLIASHTVDSPTGFSQLPGLDRNDILITRAEYESLVENFQHLPRSWQVFDLIWNDSKGHVGSIFCSLDTIIRDFRSSESETEVIKFYMSEYLVGGLTRCFGSFEGPFQITDELRNALLESVYTATSLRTGLPQSDLDLLKRLRKLGILTSDESTLAFSSPLSRRYALKYLIRDRPYSSPINLHELVVQALATLNPCDLIAWKGGAKFPVEHMLKSFVQLTAANVLVVPQLSETFSGEPGRLEMYLSGDLRFGIELRPSGNEIGSQLEDNFGKNGKYAALQVEDHVVIDFRPEDGGERTEKSEHLARVCFDQSFEKCTLLYGLNETANNIRIGTPVAEARKLWL